MPRAKMSDEEKAELRKKIEGIAAQKGVTLPTEAEIETAKANKQCWQGMSIADIGIMFSDELIRMAHLFHFMGAGYGMAGNIVGENAAGQGFNICRIVSAEPYLEQPYRTYLEVVDRVGAELGFETHMVENNSPEILAKMTFEVLDDELTHSSVEDDIEADGALENLLREIFGDEIQVSAKIVPFPAGEPQA